MYTLKLLLVLLVLSASGLLGFLYSGLYPIGADTPHTPLVYRMLETLRERSIARRIADISVPNLDDSSLLLAGGPDYNEMCSGCHLKPGKPDSELSLGLYPRPPNLSLGDEEHSHGDTAERASRQFWIVKHGIKASGMPAWGATHDDQRIWAMVAFLQRLPELTPQQYQILTARDAGG